MNKKFIVSELFFLSFSFPQRMQLDIILTSLQDHTHVASLLGYSSPSDTTETSSLCISYGNLSDQTYSVQSSHPDTHLAEILMKTLLRNLGFYTVCMGFVVNFCYGGNEFWIFKMLRISFLLPENCILLVYLKQQCHVHLSLEVD